MYSSLTSAFIVSSLLASFCLFYCQNRCTFRLLASCLCRRLNTLCRSLFILNYAGISHIFSIMMFVKGQSDDLLAIRSLCMLAVLINILFVVVLPLNGTEESAHLSRRESVHPSRRENTSKSSALE